MDSKSDRNNQLPEAGAVAKAGGMKSTQMGANR
jgi:hypothetical protein